MAMRLHQKTVVKAFIDEHYGNQCSICTTQLGNHQVPVSCVLPSKQWGMEEKSVTSPPLCSDGRPECGGANHVDNRRNLRRIQRPMQRNLLVACYD